MLNKVKIGTFIELYNKKCGIKNLTVDDVSGINRDKEFFEPSRQIGKDTSSYKVVPPNYFACNLMHVGRDRVLPISMNHTKDNKIVSPAYAVFKITNEDLILKEYFFMFLKSNEKDRYFWFNTDASVREGMTWESFCDIEITIPTIHIQKKVVAIYKAMLKNQEIYELGLNDLRLSCDLYIEKLKKEFSTEKIGSYIEISDERNTINLTTKDVRGISTSKEIISTKASLRNVNVSNYKLFRHGQIAFVPDTSRRGNKISLAINNDNTDYLVSSISIVFNIDKNRLLPSYLMLFFKRSEFDRYTRYHSWGSARETFTWEDMKEVRVPIPDLEIQNSIVAIYNAYIKRKEIVDDLKKKINDICPILIKGSIVEAKVNEKI
ncbi:restriction endonuclease subunit S [Oceanobacillus caeni]